MIYSIKSICFLLLNGYLSICLHVYFCNSLTYRFSIHLSSYLFLLAYTNRPACLSTVLSFHLSISLPSYFLLVHLSTFLLVYLYTSQSINLWKGSTCLFQKLIRTINHQNKWTMFWINLIGCSVPAKIEFLFSDIFAPYFRNGWTIVL